MNKQITMYNVIQEANSINSIKITRTFLSELYESNSKEKYPDPYKELAHRIFSCPISEVTDTQRTYAKRICLAVQYSNTYDRLS